MHNTACSKFYSSSRHYSTLSGRHGFSLVEILIGMVIFAITASGIFASLVQSTMIKQASANELEATILLNNEMEHLRALDWPQVEALSASGSFEGAEDDSSFKTQRLITTPETGQREVKLTVTWTDTKDKDFEVCVVTLLTEYD